MKILVLNGPNINMLGIREPAIYGLANYESLCNYLIAVAKELEVDMEHFQSNYEGDLVTKIQKAYRVYDGIVINPAAYTHTSIAILDALKAVALPAVEVHLTDISTRETFRHISYAGMACVKTFKGLGFLGYRKAMEYFCCTSD